MPATPGYLQQTVYVRVGDFKLCSTIQNHAAEQENAPGGVAATTSVDDQQYPVYGIAKEQLELVRGFHVWVETYNKRFTLPIFGERDGSTPRKMDLHHLPVEVRSSLETWLMKIPDLGALMDAANILGCDELLDACAYQQAYLIRTRQGPVEPPQRALEKDNWMLARALNPSAPPPPTHINPS